jgi:hypothetical protein
MNGLSARAILVLYAVPCHIASVQLFGVLIQSLSIFVHHLTTSDEDKYAIFVVPEIILFQLLCQVVGM